MTAAAIGAAITVAYIYAKNGVNGQKVPNSTYFKPAVLVAILVYVIVNYGHGQKETLSSEPF